MTGYIRIAASSLGGRNACENKTAFPSFLYPGQVVSFHTFLCGQGNGPELVKPTVFVEPPSVNASTTTYYYTGFGDISVAERDRKNVSRGVQSADVNSTPPRPSKFGIWPTLFSSNKDYVLEINYRYLPIGSDKFSSISLYYNFTFIEARGYASTPRNCSISYDNVTSTFGPVDDCRVSFTASPMFAGKYGVLSAVDPSYHGKGIENVSSINYTIPIYPIEEMEAINVSGDDGSLVGGIVEVAPDSEFNKVVLYNATAEAIFLADYMAKNCNATRLGDLTRVENYTLYDTKFNLYLMFKPDIEGLRLEDSISVGSEGFYVPLYAGLASQYINMSATHTYEQGTTSDENGFWKWITKGAVRIVPFTKYIGVAAFVVGSTIRRQKDEYVKAYIKPNLTLHEIEEGESTLQGGEDVWYVCPDDTPASVVDLL